MSYDREAGTLSHIVVLDLTTFLSGPHCTQIMADLGAEVIKVEHPRGDLTRKIPPHFVEGDSAYFLSTNRGKKSVVVDLKAPEGQAIINDLAVKCDVLVENFRPGVVNRLGLDYETLAQHNPGLVWCSISGYGQDGPYRDLPAYDMVVQAISGIMSLTGEPGRPPVRTGIPLSDLVGGMFAVIGILAALQERTISGKGQQIDISLLDCATSLLSYQGVYHLVSGEIPNRQGSGHDSIPTYRTFIASDGEEVAVTANTEKMWRGLCEAIELPSLADDPRFATLGTRYQNREALWEILENLFQARPSQEWVERLRAVDVPAATVNSVDRTLKHPQVLHRQMVLELESPQGERVRLLGNPIKLSRSNISEFIYPPKLGQDTGAVLASKLGFPNDKIERLMESGVISPAPDGAA